VSSFLLVSSWVVSLILVVRSIEVDCLACQKGQFFHPNNALHLRDNDVFQFWDYLVEFITGLKSLGNYLSQSTASQVNSGSRVNAFSRSLIKQKCVLINYSLMYLLLSSFWQSRAHPREIMTEVLKALQELNVCWKKIGHYNMKCRWIPGIPGRHEGMMNNPVHSNHYFGDESTIIENDGVTNSPNVVKFEVQVICFAAVFLPVYNRDFSVLGYMRMGYRTSKAIFLKKRASNNKRGC
jgi:hypothetical protein